MSSLIEHAKSELARLGNDKDFDEAIIKAVEAFASYGHSGGSASYAIPLLNDLLSFKNISPLTNDPDEWMKVDGGVWQSRRTPSCFSEDGGKTFYDLEDENANMMYDIRYIAKDPVVPEVTEEGDTSNDFEELTLQAADVSDIPSDSDIGRRLQAWKTAKTIVDGIVGVFELQDYKSSVAFGSSTTYTKADQYKAHIQDVANWLLGEGDF